MTRATWMGTALLAALLLGGSVLAAAVPPPPMLAARSENGRYEVQLQFPWGQPSGELAVLRMASVYRIQGGTRTKLWEVTVSYRLRAEEALISDDGESFVTLSRGIGRRDDYLLAFYTREGERRAYALGQLLTTIAGADALVGKAKPRNGDRPVTAEVLTQRLKANDLGYLRSIGLIGYSPDLGYTWPAPTVMHLDDHKGQRLFCMWLKWADKWTAWDVMTGEKVAATKEMVERWNAKAGQKALAELRTGERRPQAREFLAWLNARTDRPSGDREARGTMTTREEMGQWLDRCQESYDRLGDYVCLFVQRERIGGELLPEERARVKFKKPVMVYMKWVGKEKKGQECLYVSGRYDDKLIARGTGLAGLVAVKLDPGGRTAMRNRRHPITEAGIGHLLELLRGDYRLAMRHNEGRVVDRGRDEVNGRELRVFECILPADERPEYYCHRAVVGFDTELMLPVTVSIYDAKGRLLEQYRYEDLVLDVGLTEKDFDRDNPEYRF